MLRGETCGAERSQLRICPIPNAWRSSCSWALLLSAAAIGVLARWIVPSAAGSRLPASWLPPCFFRRLTGIPCPFCGLTTASAWLARGQIEAAWNSNMLSPIVGLAFVALVIYVTGLRLIAGRAIVFEINSGLRRWLWALGILLIILSWARNIAFT